MSRPRKSWAKRLEEAEKRGMFTAAETGYASQWTQCAIGEKHNWPTEHQFGFGPERGTPEKQLGVQFMFAIMENNIPLAKSIYQQIQELP